MKEPMIKTIEEAKDFLTNMKEHYSKLSDWNLSVHAADAALKHKLIAEYFEDALNRIYGYTYCNPREVLEEADKYAWVETEKIKERYMTPELQSLWKIARNKYNSVTAKDALYVLTKLDEEAQNGHHQN